MTLISGTIKVVTYVQGGATSTIEEVDIDAGHGYAQVSTGGRRLHALAALPSYSRPRPRAARELSACDGDGLRTRREMYRTTTAAWNRMRVSTVEHPKR